MLPKYLPFNNINPAARFNVEHKKKHMQLI